MMKSPQIALVYNRKKTATTKKRATLEVRITWDRKVKYISTGISLLPKEWNGRCIISRLDCVRLQDRLNLIIENIQRVINDMMKEGFISLQEIPSRLFALEKENMSFLDFCEDRCEVRQHGLSGMTIKRYEHFMDFLKKWNKIVWFTDITDIKILELDRYLISKNLKPSSRWNNYHRFLNSFILDAINEGYVQRNPYRWLRIDKEHNTGSIDKYLTKEEFDAIKNLDRLTPSLEHVRDLFVLQVYTCMAYVDLIAFDPNNIQTDSKGRSLYIANRGKTNVEFTILLLPDAIEILKKYDYRLPVISNQKYNDYLKIIAHMAYVNKPITSHWARHTGATLLLNAGVDMEIVAKVLGHSSTKITRSIYAKLLDTTVADAVDNIKNLI